MVKTPITYGVRKIIEEDVNNNKRVVKATVEKIMNLRAHLKPIITTFEVTYPVWDNNHMFHLVDTLPPRKSLDNLERTGIAEVLKLFN